MIQTQVVEVGVILGEDRVEVFVEAISNFWATSNCVISICHSIGEATGIG